LRSSAVLAIWVDIDPADDALFNLWHSREHMQERVGCPGWRRGSRFRGLSKPGRYFLLYEADNAAAFDSPVYYARLGSPTPMSRAVLPKFRDTSRTVCTVERHWGDGIGAVALTLRLAPGKPAPFDAISALEPARVDLLAGQPAIGQAHTTEKDLRAVPDRQIAQALVAFFWSQESAEAAREKFAPASEIFVLQHSVSKDDLAAASAAS
jgi:hypothetical protein